MVLWWMWKRSWFVNTNGLDVVIMQLCLQSSDMVYYYINSIVLGLNKQNRSHMTHYNKVLWSILLPDYDFFFIAGPTFSRASIRTGMGCFRGTGSGKRGHNFSSFTSWTFISATKTGENCRTWVKYLLKENPCYISVMLIGKTRTIWCKDKLKNNLY